MVIVDTSVWIRAMRIESSNERRELDSLLALNEVLMIGPVLAELLQGTRSAEEFEQLRFRLAVLPFIKATRDIWGRSGAISYRLYREGVPLGLLDLLIAAFALENGYQLYTLDTHFERVPDLELYTPTSIE